MTFLRKLFARDPVRALELALFGSGFLILPLRYCGTTSMSQDYPPLALDDLVHLMSPSPAPQTPLDDSDMPPPAKSASPEPLPESDIVQMRTKVVEMRHIDNADAQLTPRERELAAMVCIACLSLPARI